jgi:hypothetical protein
MNPDIKQSYRSKNPFRKAIECHHEPLGPGPKAGSNEQAIQLKNLNVPKQMNMKFAKKMFNSSVYVHACVRTKPGAIMKYAFS